MLRAFVIVWNILRWPFYLSLVPTALFFSVATYLWYNSEQFVIRSAALSEERSYTVFGSEVSSHVVYSLDGGNLRNGLFPATIATIASWINARPSPKIIAVHSNKNRNRDFRPEKVKPKYWRPDISGRSADFDRFLLEELIPEVEKQHRQKSNRYLFGHSLSGLYALELSGRYPRAFIGIYAFSPTFSHDMSIVDRLAMLCDSQRTIYVNIGLESRRDTAVFDEVINFWKRAPECQAYPPNLIVHPGIIHGLIMLTGQVDAALFNM